LRVKKEYERNKEKIKNKTKVVLLVQTSEDKIYNQAIPTRAKFLCLASDVLD